MALLRYSRPPRRHLDPVVPSPLSSSLMWWWCGRYASSMGSNCRDLLRFAIVASIHHRGFDSPLLASLLSPPPSLVSSQPLAASHLNPLSPSPSSQRTCSGLNTPHPHLNALLVPLTLVSRSLSIVVVVIEVVVVRLLLLVVLVEVSGGGGVVATARTCRGSGSHSCYGSSSSSSRR
jgi:hypothetical protein